MKANFAVAYGVKAAEVRFEFDGSAVRDSDTAEGLDMEDEDILEAKVSINLLVCFCDCVSKKNNFVQYDTLSYSYCS